MANESTLTTSSILERAKATLSRGPSGQSLDGISGDPNPSGGSGGSGATPAPEGHPPDHRRHGGRGGGEGEASGNEGNRGVSESAASSDSPFSQSSNILKTIADRFNAIRETNRAGAWRQFQKDLMDASPFICPTTIPYKDLISVVADIEKEIKGSSSVIGKSNEELLAEFLNGGGSIPVREEPVNEGDNQHVLPEAQPPES